MDQLYTSLGIIHLFALSDGGWLFINGIRKLLTPRNLARDVDI